MKITPRSVRIIIGVVLALGFASPRLRADDLGFHEAGARAAALGGAFTARADDTSSLFSNPAGLAFLGGIQIMTNMRFGSRSLDATKPSGGLSYTSSPYEIGGAHAVSWQFLKRVTLGIGIFSPYSFQAEWPATWDARTISITSQLKSRYFRSALAVELVKGLAVSVGVDIVSASLEWRHDILFNLETYPLPSDAYVSSRHSAAGHGLGFVAGALWKISPAVRVGAAYQSPVAIDHAGQNIFAIGRDMAYTPVPDPYGGSIIVSRLLDMIFRPQDVTGRLAFPRQISFGVAWRPLLRLSVTADVQWDRWSRFGDWVFRSVNEGGELSPDFGPVYQEFYGYTPDYGAQGVPLALKDTIKIQAGLEFHFARYLALRTGFARHESSLDADTRTPVYPDLDRTLYSLGFGYEGPVFSIYDDTERVSDLSFDLFVRYASAKAGESVFPGLDLSFGSNRVVFGVGVGFAF